MAGPRPRINASMLNSNVGNAVCVLGTAHSPSGDGKSFQLTTSDKKDITIRLQEPLQEYIEGLVEVIGTVDGGNAVSCQTYVNFPSETTQQFDMDAYDKAVQLMNQHSEHYITGGEQ